MSLPDSPALSEVDSPARVLVTGAGGPAAYGFLRMVTDPTVELWAADMDPLAAGLYLVDRSRRLLLPRATDPAFTDTVLEACRRHQIDVLVPTVDDELLVLAADYERFTEAGIKLLMNPPSTLKGCLDKLVLARLCAEKSLVPRTELLTSQTEAWFPAIVKPRSGSGSRGVKLVEEPADLVGVPLDGSYIIQEFLPGEEYSVDVLVRGDGTVVAAVPRTRDKVDSGVAVASRTVLDRTLIDAATTVAQVIGVRGVANVQLRRNAKGRAALLEVNPRLPGTLVLTAAAGANLAALALDDVLGREVPDHLEVREVAVVRHLSEIVVPLPEYGAESRTHETAVAP